MKAAQLRHQSDSRYCFVVEDGRLLLRLAIDRDVNVTSVKVTFGPPQGFNKRHQDQEMFPRYDDGDFIYYETILEARPSRFYYIFKIEENGEKYIYDENGLAKTFNFELAFLSAFQMIAENRADFTLPKPSWQGRVFYQIFPERFACRGNPKDKPYVNRDWNSTRLGGMPPAFIGGDIWGIIDKLDYIESLGTGAIYLNPIHPSLSNHKYDVLDYFGVEEAFGGKEAFHQLIQKAHERDIKVVLDMVFNHTSAQHPFFKDCLEKGKDSPYFDYYFIHGDKPNYGLRNYDCFAEVRDMPKLDTSNPKVQEYLISVASYWMKEFNVDGFRLDVCEGVSHEFWTLLKMALKKINPDVYLLGEIWMNSESYLGPNQIDGLMNYPFLGAISNYVLGNNDADKTAKVLSGLLTRYKQGNVLMMLNLLSSHDIQRFIRLCGGDKSKFLCAYAIMFAFPGMPSIYYGDEIFLDGGGDPDCRRGMPWNSSEFASQEHAVFKQLGQLRKHRKELQFGEAFLSEENGLLHLKRVYGGQEISLFINLTPNPISIDGQPILSYNHKDGVLGPSGFLFC